MDARPDDDADADRAADAPRPPERATGPGPDGPAAGATSDDEVWASLVARLGDLPTTDDAADVGAADVGATDVGTRPAPDAAPAAPAPPATGRDWDGTSQYDAAEDDVDELEHFVPPDPGPVLGGDPLLTLAWAAALVPPVFLLLVVVAWRDAPSLLVRGAGLVFVVAVGVLVWRMPRGREPSDDDGAVV